MKQALKLIMPPLLVHLLKQFSKKTWSGSFASWSDAVNATTGYSTDEIILKLDQAQQKVIEGAAAFERDTVTFAKEEINFPLVASLLFAKKNDSISVIDFGGALGSTYYQNKKALENSVSKWGIIEQEKFTELGIEKYQSENLRFFRDLSSAINELKPKVLLSSSTLQYLENPFQVIEDFLKYDVEFILLDRIAFNKGKGHRITKQQVPSEIYTASYPCWFFDEKVFLSKFHDKYSLIWEFNNNDLADIPSYFKGYLFKLKSDYKNI